MAVAGCDPDEMGIGPVFAVPKLLKAHGLKVDDIGLWELNEAFAVQVLYCRDRLGIDNDKLNVDGGAIADRPSLRHERRAPDRPRADRGQAPRRALRRRDDVRRRRHGRGRPVRGRVTTATGAGSAAQKVSDPSVMSPLEAFQGPSRRRRQWFERALAQTPERTFIEVEGAALE